MKNLAFLALAAAAVGVTAANSQTQPITPPSPNVYGGGGYYGGSHASTAAEGGLRGMGDLVRSQGQANLSNSAAAINYSIAQKNEIENRSQWTHTYFQMRKANREYRAAERGPRPTMEDLVRYAQRGKPKRLGTSEVDTVTGAINWPVLLRSDEFAASRSELEAAFARRASHSAIDAEDYAKVKRATSRMLADLKKQVRNVPSNQYMIAKRFIESLAYEAGLPAA